MSSANTGDFRDSYGHSIAVAGRDGGGCVILIGPSAQVADFDRSLHLDYAQSCKLLQALVGCGAEVGSPTRGSASEQGFTNYGAVATGSGVSIRVQESSAACGPHVWLFQEDCNGGYEGTLAEIALDVEQTCGLATLLSSHIEMVAERWGTEWVDCQLGEVGVLS
jgi:hypothetical protein